MKPRKGDPARYKGRPIERWIIKDEVWHPLAKRMIRRKDGKPFRFPIRRRWKQ